MVVSSLYEASVNYYIVPDVNQQPEGENMVFVPGFQHDIFVSYAHVDDVPLPGVEKGWVTNLIDTLKTKLSMQLGRSDAYSLWMDYELAHHVKLTPQIMDALNHTAIMVVILSPGYLASEWCMREKNTFLQFIKEGSSRVFVIERNIIEAQDRPSEFEDLIGFRFWLRDREGKPPKILGEPKPSPDELDYYRVVDEVVSGLQKALGDLKREHENHADGMAGYQEPSVFLAEVTDDLEQERASMKSYLNQFGINTLPNTWYSQEPTNFRQCAQRDLAQCLAFVQLLSGSTGRKPPDLPKGYLSLQLELAEAMGKKVFQWRSPSLDINSLKDEEHKLLVNGAKVHAEGIEEFKRSVKDFVMKPAPVKILPHLDALVFVNMESSDRSLAVKVCGELERHGIGYGLPINSGNPSEIREDLEANLLESNGIIIIYGCSTVAWVRRQLLECRKILSKREKPLQAFAIFEGPPEQKCPIDLKLPNLQMLDLRQGVNDALLEKELSVFIESLEKESV